MQRALPPELESRYRVAARLGAGGAKEVFRAVDLRGGPDVAIAHVPFVDPDTFHAEVELLRRAPARYVPALLDALIDGGDDGYLVMELCEGPNLACLADRPLLPAEAGPILRELARALQAIHGSRVLHRDLKPENVVLCAAPEGVRLVVLDFALSRRDTAVSAVLTRGEGGAGLAYLAREVLRGEAIDARADVYAFAVCCYRLLAGEVPLPPSPGEPDFDYVARLARADRFDPTPLAALPAALPALLARALATDRERRPALPELVAAFEAAFGQAPLAIPAASRDSAVALRPARARAAIPRVLVLEAELATPEHALVAACPAAPFVLLEPDADETRVRALGAGGAPRWSRRVSARLVAGLRADLDGDGSREVYLAGPELAVAFDASGALRFARPAPAPAAAPTLGAAPGGAGAMLLVDGHAIEPRTGQPLGTLLRVYEGDGRALADAADRRGASYHAHALQAFRGARGTGAAILAREAGGPFEVAQLEVAAGRGVALGVYGPGGARVAGAWLARGEAAAASAARLGPAHAPIALLGADARALVVVPLLGADPAGPPSVAAIALPDGAIAWRREVPAQRGRAVLGDLDGDGAPELLIGTGDCVLALDPWTGERRYELACAGAPIAVGDPARVGFVHLVAVSGEGLELWRGGACAPGAMQWSGPRADLWRTGALRADGAPVGPI